MASWQPKYMFSCVIKTALWSDSFWLSAGTLLFLSSRPPEFKAAEIRGSREKLACIISWQDTIATSPVSGNGSAKGMLLNVKQSVKCCGFSHVDFQDSKCCLRHFIMKLGWWNKQINGLFKQMNNQNWCKTSNYPLQKHLPIDILLGKQQQQQPEHFILQSFFFIPFFKHDSLLFI